MYVPTSKSNFIETLETLQGLALVSWYRSVAPPATHATQLATGGVACDGRVAVCLMVLCERNSDAGIGGSVIFVSHALWKQNVDTLSVWCLDVSFHMSQAGWVHSTPPFPHWMNIYCISLGQRFGFAWLLFEIIAMTWQVPTYLFMFFFRRLECCRNDFRLSQLDGRIWFELFI